MRRVATTADVTAVRTDVANLEHKLEVGIRDVTIRSGGMLVVAVGVLLGFKFFG